MSAKKKQQLAPPHRPPRDEDEGEKLDNIQNITAEYVPQLPSDEEANFYAPVVKYALLGLICLLSFAIRLFAVVRWESVSKSYVC